MYQRIAAIATEDDREDITDELLDRFGDVPAVVEALLDIAQLRALANSIGVSQVLFRAGTLMLKLSEQYAPTLPVLLKALSETDGRLSLSAKPPVGILLKDPRLAERDMLKEGVKVLKKLTANVEKASLG